MGRLIDADALIEVLKNKPRYSIELPANIGDSIQKLLAVHQKMVVDVVKEQPTAYNVDKVVEELDNKAYTTTDTVCGGVFEAIRLSSAIEIVKKGGVEHG